MLVDEVVLKESAGCSKTVKHFELIFDTSLGNYLFSFLNTTITNHLYCADLICASYQRCALSLSGCSQTANHEYFTMSESGLVHPPSTITSATNSSTRTTKPWETTFEAGKASRIPQSSS